MDPMTWLRSRTGAAPAALRERIMQHVARAGAPDMPDLLARAGASALRDVTDTPGERSVALDLLAADGLITLAMLWCAEHDPAALGRVARALTEPAPAT
jgi:hypothetical protein